MTSIRQAVAQARQHAYELETARNEGRHEGITVFFDRLEQALARGVDIHEWARCTRALYEEYRPQ